MTNNVWFGVTSQLCEAVTLGGCVCTNVPEYSSVIKRTFAINSVIVVAISHILNAIYLKSNESSGSTSGCNGGILLKIHNFHWSQAYTKDANMGGIDKLLRGCADKSLARPRRKKLSDQSRDFFNILPTLINILLNPLF